MLLGHIIGVQWTYTHMSAAEVMLMSLFIMAVSNRIDGKLVFAGDTLDRARHLLNNTCMSHILHFIFPYRTFCFLSHKRGYCFCTPIK